MTRYDTPMTRSETPTTPYETPTTPYETPTTPYETPTTPYETPTTPYETPTTPYETPNTPYETPMWRDHAAPVDCTSDSRWGGGGAQYAELECPSAEVGDPPSTVIVTQKATEEREQQRHFAHFPTENLLRFSYVGVYRPRPAPSGGCVTVWVGWGPRSHAGVALGPTVFGSLPGQTQLKRRHPALPCEPPPQGPFDGGIPLWSERGSAVQASWGTRPSQEVPGSSPRWGTATAPRMTTRATAATVRWCPEITLGLWGRASTGGGLGARDALERGEEVPPPPLPLQGAQPMPSHCLPDGKCQARWR